MASRCVYASDISHCSSVSHTLLPCFPALQTACLVIELSHAPISLMPRLMARLGALADRLWHNGGLFSERPPSAAAGSSRALVTLHTPTALHEKPSVQVQLTTTALTSFQHSPPPTVLSLPLDSLQMTARGAWPFALLYQLHHTLLGLLPDVASTITVTATKVACPACLHHITSLEHARAVAADKDSMVCPKCGAASSVTGFASWEMGLPHAKHLSLVDAALLAAQSVDRSRAVWKDRVRHARNKLLWWSRQHVLSSSSSSADSMPPLWTVQGGSMVPVCEHPHLPHAVAMASGPALPRSVRPLTSAYLQRTHALATLGDATATPPHSFDTSTSATTSSTTSLSQHLEAYCISHSSSLPLQQVVDPDDSSQRRWLCPQHAAELAPRGSGNVFDYVGGEELVDVSFLRWLRVGVALKVTSEELARVLAVRVEEWYERVLVAKARELMGEEERASVERRRREAEVQARDDEVARVLGGSLEAAVRVVGEAVVGGGGSVQGGGIRLRAALAVEKCSKTEEWFGHLLECSDDVTTAELRPWKGVPQPRRHIISLQHLPTAIGRGCRVGGARQEELVALATRAFTEELGRQCSGCRLFTLHKALAVKHAVLLDLDMTTAPTAPPPPAPTQPPSSPIPWHCTNTNGTCSSQPSADVLCSTCFTCRNFAKAIKAYHRKPRSLSLANWRNCIPQHWSSASAATAAWAAAKAYTSSGSNEATCFEELDFAALVNIVDFCTHLATPGSSSSSSEEEQQQWQPEGPMDSNCVLANLLQPARTARNEFAHNSALAFYSEAKVGQHIEALATLLEVLPVVGDDGGARRKQALHALHSMMELGVSDAGTGRSGHRSRWSAAG